MNALIIVAHPDDEIIWCGGLVLRHPEWDWTVLSLCRAGDADRAPKFRQVCEHVGARGIIDDLDDSPELKPIDADAEIGALVAQHLGVAEWDLCLTHGRNGEYGHPRHTQAHAAVAALIGRGALRCGQLWTFAYEANPAERSCRPAAWADLSCPLTDVQLAEKKHIVRDLYGYPADGFEVRACISPEAFLRVKDAATDHERLEP